MKQEYQKIKTRIPKIRNKNIKQEYQKIPKNRNNIISYKISTKIKCFVCFFFFVFCNGIVPPVRVLVIIKKKNEKKARRELNFCVGNVIITLHAVN